MSKDNHIPEPADAQKEPGKPKTSDLSEISVPRATTPRRGKTHMARLIARPSHDMDEDTLLNAVHVPTDACTYAEALQRIPCRIPHGWCVGSATTRAGIRSWPFSMTASRARAALLLRTQRQAEHRTAFCDSIAEAERVSAITRARCGKPRIRRRRDKWRETLCAACAKSLGCPSIRRR